MLVCRRWHSIAIQTASLWTEIDLAARPSSAIYFLERSRADPFRLRANIDETENQQVQSIIRHQRHRISQLALRGPSSAQPEAHASLADVAMPVLRQLTLTFEPRSRADPSTRAHFAKPEHVPALRALLLSGALWVPVGIVPSLTHILVKNMKNVSVSLIWNLLCNTPMLEVFEMSSNTGLAVARSLTPSSGSSLTLPRLRCLTITCAYTNVVHYLVSRLDLPSINAVSFEFLFVQSGTLLERLLPGSLAAHTPTRVTLVIGGDHHTFTAGFQGDGSTVTLSYFNSSDETTPPPEERRQWPFTTFPTLLSLARVTTFRLSSSVWEPQDCLLRLGAHLGSVTELCVMLDPNHDGSFNAAMALRLARALARALLADDPVVFPNLRSLDIDTVDTSRDFIAVLMPALAKRDLDGRRLRHLCVRIGALWPGDPHEDLRATGLFNRVDEGSCRRSDYSSRRNWEREIRHDMPRPPTHGYW
ncbi:hypothetical protein GSI_07940 [Ganoderma sinense ZZ0214-1]|uniref:F-box domain-containing protein n=1 Tax=Ganoderma sinense ZZ0214-1 TaxID=1077348 RepID=A0A2G8S904_9APHY|nr:hypothetical protein GSI_07940 [Ganoderma sinense ZZ0214-1]